MSKNKFLVYTSNPKATPKSMEDVMSWAKNTPKMYICSVDLLTSLHDVEAGDQIITPKGNHIYVLRAITEDRENWSENTRREIDEWTRLYGLKNQNITGVSQITKFGTWCKCAKSLLISESKSSTINNCKKDMKKNSFTLAGMADRLMKMYLPEQVNNVRISMLTGDVCVETPEGFVTIDAAGELTGFDEAFTFDFPAFAIQKPIAQIAVGDVIEHNGKYYKVAEIRDGGKKLKTISYTGGGHEVHPIKDLFLGATIRTITPLNAMLNVGGAGNGQQASMGLLMYSLLKKEGGDNNSLSSLLPFMLMSGFGGAQGANPMGNPAMMLALTQLTGKKDNGAGTDLESLLPFMMMGGMGAGFGAPVAGAPAQPNFFGGLFGGFGAAAPAAPAPAAKAPKARKARVAKAEKKEVAAEAAE